MTTELTEDDEPQRLWGALLAATAERRRTILASLLDGRDTAQICWMGDHARRIEFLKDQNEYLARDNKRLRDLVDQVGVPLTFPAPTKGADHDHCH